MSQEKIFTLAPFVKKMEIYIFFTFSLNTKILLLFRNIRLNLNKSDINYFYTNTRFLKKHYLLKH